MHSILIGSVPVPGFAAEDLQGPPRVDSVAFCGRLIDTP
jgi:hypothetical protein